MKMKWLLLLVPLLACSGMVGCRTVDNRRVADKLVPFTGKHLEEFNEYLEEIQFYISRQVVLHRTTASKKTDVTGVVHTIRIEKDTKIQSITFPAKTPGVFFGMDSDTLKIQFEPARDGRNRTLPFRKESKGSGGGGPADAVFVFDSETIVYDGNEYEVYYEEVDVMVTEKDDTIYAEKARSDQEQFIIKKRYPILLINPVKKISRLNEENRVVPGVWEEDSVD